MHNSPVVVKKGGFFSALAYGVFGTLIAAVICGSGLGLYGLNIADRKSSEIIMLGHGLLGALPDIQEALPPVLADILNDRRDLEYRNHLDISTQVLPNADSEKYTRYMVEVTNNGPKAISVLSLRVTLDDENGIPLREHTTYLATPIAVEDEWRGPLLPGSTRRVTYPVRKPWPDKATAEITELRVWDPRERDADA